MNSDEKKEKDGQDTTEEAIDLTDDDNVEEQEADDDISCEVMSTHSSLEGINCSESDSSDDETIAKERAIKCLKCGCNYERLLGHECRLQEPLFACSLCSYKFIREEFLRNHLVNFHAIDDDSHLARLDLTIFEPKSEPSVERDFATYQTGSSSRATTIMIDQEEEEGTFDYDEDLNEHSSLECVSLNSRDSPDADDELNFNGFSPRPMKCKAKKPTGKGSLIPRIECQKCLRNFANKKKLTEHLNRACEIVPIFPCLQCDYRTISKRHLDTHLIKRHNVHRSQLPDSDLYPFKCDECFRTYKNKVSLRQHVKLECGVSPAFPCPICDHQTTQKYNLRNHLINVHKIERSQLASYEVGPTFRCTVCPFRAKLKTDLLMHVRAEHNCN